MKVVVLTLIIFVKILVLTGSSAVATQGPGPRWTWVESRLKKEGFHPRFIKALKTSYTPDSFREVTELNLLLYLKKEDYHGPQVDDRARTEVQDFLSQNRKTFAAIEKRYGVDRHVIAGLIWMESRFGKNKGTFNVPSVFAHLLQVTRPQVQKQLFKAAEDYGPVTPSIRSEIRNRTVKKSKWAFKELRAVEKIYLSRKKDLKTWKGSFSGAYGLPQFLPTSDLAYAKSFHPKASANLYDPKDAIASVAHYLKKHGWKSHRPKTHANALFKYNNSRDYAEAILDLSRRSRRPASSK